MCEASAIDTKMSLIKGYRAVQDKQKSMFVLFAEARGIDKTSKAII